MNIDNLSRLILSSRFDVCHSRCTFDYSRMIYRSRVNGRSIKLFKVLLSNRCRFDCKYCRNAWYKGISASPEEIAKVFRIMKEKNLVSGAFISSAVDSDPDNVMEKLLETGRLIRKFHSGYLHLKIIPGSSPEYIEEAIDLANRVSINLETTSDSRMNEISSVKRLKEDIFRKQRKIQREIKKAKEARRSQTTQIIAGIGESDLEILKIMHKEYSEIGVSRVYISGFTPLKGTPMENFRKERRKRVVNLYRMDALLRMYGYSPKLIESVMEDGMLPSIDPKMAIAEKLENLELEQIPGCGKRISQLLRQGKSLAEIKRMGYSIKRISAYLPAQTKLTEF
ncbi:putative DNA-binding protein with the Helix-hairpin-helix motif [Archaeoglobus sulfaticallidus PM70-1]|uniref:Putative DNA-binding protein with the Helix-hairpin-helix motif n=1 Tax=Archaeoglobus sulfaticallidus PM70-1 TaxID=387631 RepID=N0BL12_9EURY|nr:radical SAM protein [Archaeoglobus sulfaticallidus]AGK60900.1 putative DNA-binding protein with the Helix-hairpin-helix motif [Archaeoglobus sulfaticallidus PM70-1]